MIDPKTARLQKVKQILLAMDCQIVVESDSVFWNDGGLWYLVLPDDESGVVYLGFTAKAGRDFIADVSARFSVNATLMRLKVYLVGISPQIQPVRLADG